MTILSVSAANKHMEAFASTERFRERFELYVVS